MKPKLDLEQKYKPGGQQSKILSRVLVTETGFGLVIGFINRVTGLNYKQLLITLSVIQFTIIFY
jgi:hypothetical protein